MTRHRTPASSWISAVTYTPTGAGRGRVAIEKRDGDPIVYPSVPSWVVVLMLAGSSPGKAYNRIIRGRFEAAPTEPEPESDVDLVPALEASLAHLATPTPTTTTKETPTCR